MPNRVKLADGTALDLPYIQVGVMGEPGSGKSHFAASFPTPMLVIATDPMTKMQPYFDRGWLDPDEHAGPFNQEIRLVRDKPGEEGGVVTRQIEGFYDYDVTMLTSAMTAVGNRTASVVQEVRDGKWATVVLDSWSGFEDAASYRRLAGPMKCANSDGRAHRNMAKEDCKQIFLMQLIRLKCNVVITFHTTKYMQDQGGETQYNMKCIGDFASTVGQNLAERYHSVAQPDGTTRVLYTRPDGRFKLATLIDAPSPSENTFGALWTNYIAKKLATAKSANGANAAPTAPQPPA